MIDNIYKAIIHAREVAREKRAEEQEWRDKKDFIESNERNPKGIYDIPINQCKECAADHEQLASWLEELAERRETDRWIPVSERLPEPLKEVLVTSTNGYVYTSRIVHGEFEYGGNIIAWQPLPKPYESEAEDD